MSTQLCAVCEDAILTRALRDEVLGLVCVPCGSIDIPHATVALVSARLFAPLRQPKNSKPRKTTK